VLVLVNNAGVRADGLAPMIDDDDWDRVLDTNLSPPSGSPRRALRPMIRARYGRVVNISSIVGAVRGTRARPTTLLPRPGLVAMTRTVAAEVARRGVTGQRRGPRSDRDRHDRGHRRQLAGARARPTGRARRMRWPSACASWRRMAPRT
jgi:NAD(P)-dependent dehydrogenase (short-subunit alcohol dehydrogenase family)